MVNHFVCAQFRKNSLRLPLYDYGVNGIYFVTMCTANRELFVGMLFPIITPLFF